MKRKYRKPKQIVKPLGQAEAKLASNHENLANDFQKLLEFKERFAYEHLIEAIVGDNEEWSKTENHLQEIYRPKYEQIRVITCSTTI